MEPKQKKFIMDEYLEKFDDTISDYDSILDKIINNQQHTDSANLGINIEPQPNQEICKY
jgi:hypothetical protein